MIGITVLSGIDPDGMLSVCGKGEACRSLKIRIDGFTVPVIREAALAVLIGVDRLNDGGYIS